MENIITNEQINEAIFLNKKEKIEESLRTTYRKKIWKNFIKAIKEFDLIKDGDKIAVGVSGGKDSLLLCKLFQELKKDRSKNLTSFLFESTFPDSIGQPQLIA